MTPLTPISQASGVLTPLRLPSLEPYGMAPRTKPCFLETGVPQGLVPAPLLFSLDARSLGSAITSHGFSYHCYADNTKLFLAVLPSSDTHVAMRILKRLADISPRTTAHHLIPNLHKTELLFVLGIDCPHVDLSATIKDVTVSPSLSAINLGVIHDDRLSCIPNITAGLLQLSLGWTTSCYD